MENTTVIRKDNEIDEINQFLNFIIQQELFVFEITNISEIIKFNQITHFTRIPMAHESIFGVINLRGQVIPVIDLSMRLFGTKTAITEQSCVIILEKSDYGEDIAVGTIVDEINDIIDVPEKCILESPDFGAKIRPEFISKIIKINGSISVLLNIDEVINVDELSEISAADFIEEKFTSMEAAGNDGSLFEASREEENGEEAEEKSFIVLEVDEDKYGVDVLHISEIVKHVEIKRIPNTLPFMKGVIDLRGIIIPVIDMRERCGLESIKNETDAPVLILKSREVNVGLIVDSTRNIIKINESNIQHPEHYTSRINSDFIGGLFRQENSIIILLNIDKILSHDEYDSIKDTNFIIPQE